MIYAVLADAVVVLHLLWILFLILGAMPGRRIRWVRWLHLSALAFSINLQLMRGVCPLTHLEVWLRRRSGGGDYTGSFLGHYAERLVYTRIDPVWLLAGTLLVVAATLWTYWRTGLHTRRQR